MYARYAERLGWKTTLLHSNQTEVGGFKEAVFEITRGQSEYPVQFQLKYESGVHRVQRVPETEKVCESILRLLPSPFFRKLKKWILALILAMFA